MAGKTPLWTCTNHALEIFLHIHTSELTRNNSWKAASISWKPTVHGNSVDLGT